MALEAFATANAPSEGNGTCKHQFEGEAGFVVARPFEEGP